MKIHSYIKQGNSFPVILEDNGTMFFVKLRAGMSGEHALINEWLGNRLGAQLQIKTQNPSWIFLDKGVDIDGINLEVTELIRKSLGINIGFKYIENAVELKNHELTNIDKKITLNIYLFDLIMINIDRTPQNMNLMSVGNEIVSVDYESSLLIQDLIDSNHVLNNSRILQSLRNNPLYRKITKHDITDFLQKLNMLSIKDIFGEIPESILNKDIYKLLIKRLEKRKKCNWFLSETVDKLKEFSAETDEDKKRKMKKNQEDFKRKFNENLMP